MSQLDIFLILDNLMDLWKIGGQVIGSRDLLDHCVI